MRRTKKSQHLVQIAQNCIDDSKFSQAIKLLNQAIQLDPNRDEAYRLRGDCFEEIEERQQAEKNYLLCLERNPLSVICYINYGLLLYKVGRREQAQKIYELCLQINPEDPTCLNNYSVLLLETGRMDKAEQISRKCLKLDPSNQNCMMNIAKISLSRENSILDEIYIQGKSDQAKLEQIIIQRDQEIEQQKRIIGLQTKIIAEKDTTIEALKRQISLMNNLKEEEEQRMLCKICWNKKAIFVNGQCGHLCSCFSCLQIVGISCPLCRTQGKFMRVYGSLIKE